MLQAKQKFWRSLMMLTINNEEHSRSLYRRVILITNGNTTSMIALARWMEEHGNNLSAIYVTKNLPSSKSNIHGVWSMMRQSGLQYTTLKVFLNVILPLWLKLVGLPYSVTSLAHKIGLGADIKHVVSLRDPKIMQEIRDKRPDLIVSFSATQRFSDELIEIPEHGAINVHYGALPRYAGLSPYYWHLSNGEREYGVTMHIISSRVDAGDIIDQIRSPIDRQASVLSLLLSMASSVSPLLIKLFERGESDFSRLSQDLRQRTYYGHPSRQQVKEFLSQGGRFMRRSDIKLIIRAARKLNSRGA